MPVPGMSRRTIDVCFPRQRIAVFLDGCFWHGCPEHGTSPKRNSAWWRAKIAANRDRDADTDGHLTAQGWTALRFWAHEPVDAVVETVTRNVNAARLR
jgi:DNA mismatch endonuclease (patch repair protein)